jgi:citrate synthase
MVRLFPREADRAPMSNQPHAAQPAAARSQGTMKVEDGRTGRRYELAITDDTIAAKDLRQIKVAEEDFGMMSFDPALDATVVTRSRICFIDGDKGILDYRGYPIEQLAEKSDFLEVAYLILHGELPTAAQREGFEAEVRAETRVPESMLRLHEAMSPDVHPMSMLTAALAALGGDFPDAAKVLDPESRRRQIVRLVALTPVVAALGYRRRNGLDVAGLRPRPELSYTANFLHMMLDQGGRESQIHVAFERAMDALLVLHAEHELNCSTNAVRAVGSSQVNPYSAVAAACAALHGPLHGGANQAVLEMLEQIPSVDAVPAFLASCKTGERRLMGFGHRVYKNYDPRAKVIKELAEKVFEVVGSNPKLAIARALESAAVQDPYFSERKLYPNVDFYSGLIYASMGFLPRIFTVFFAVARMVGWLAHWDEMLRDPKTRIVRPRQIYVGAARRDWVPLERR